MHGLLVALFGAPVSKPEARTPLGFRYPLD
jgi:hypothetical protein